MKQGAVAPGCSNEDLLQCLRYLRLRRYRYVCPNTLRSAMLEGCCSTHSAGGGLFGFDISSMSGVLGTYAYTNYFQVQGSYRQGGITASMPLGSLIGALCSSFLADKFSRKVAIQIASVFWIVGSVYVGGYEKRLLRLTSV